MEPHKILGVPPDATLDDIQRAYRAQATRYHPDHGGEAWAFQQVREAYERLIREHAARSSGGDLAATAPPADPVAPQNTSSPPGAAPHAGSGGRPPRDAPPASPRGTNAAPSLSDRLRGVWKIAFRQLPLQNETTTFILVNVLDVFMTYILIRFGAIEANPVAQFFLQRWDISGMVFFKMALVAFVCVVVQAIAHQHLERARRVLQFGTVVVGLVVVYGVFLFIRHYGS